jgi:pimeloyl-ACP methyl ester carboxylesterase
MARQPASRKRAPAAPLRATLTNGHGMSDEEIERSLLTGENAGLLEDYFGAEHYEELRQLTLAAASRSVRGGDRVLILPGIMGSKLGYRRPLLPGLPDVIWADPFDIALGRLSELELGGPRRNIEALGVILFAYLSLKLRLRIAGFDVDFVPYDWRRSMRVLGRDLANRIATEPGPVHLVAHSMGGLVARASLNHSPRIGRIVMLGTPNFGSFAPVQAVRGAYGLLNRIAQWDRRHTMAQLAAIFGAFPGLLEMIPSASLSGRNDLFELANWPGPGQRPDQAALRSARAIQDALPRSGGGSEIIMIAGINQQTVVDATVQGDEFAYTLSTEGDGTVPLRLALLPGVQTYYVEGEHGSLPGNAAVQRALPSILATGHTAELPETPPQQRQVAVRTVREHELIPPAPAPAAGSLPSVREQRLMLAEFAAPPERAAPMVVAVPAPVSAGDVRPSALDQISDMIVVGRGRERRLELTLAHGSIVDADAQCYVVGLFKTVAPSGAASALDAMMNGAISDLVARRMFRANVGEISVLPNGAYPMRAKSVAFVGLGAFDSFAPETLEIVAENLIRTFCAGRVDDFAVVPFGGSSGAPPLTSLRHLMTGFLRGLEDADADHRFRGITICERDRERFEAIRGALLGLSHTKLFDQVEVTFRERILPERFAPLRQAAAPEAERVYLIVREAAESEADTSARPPLIASVLTSGDKAAIHSGEQPDAGDAGGALDRHLASLDGIGAMSEAQLDTFGDRLASLVLADNVRQALARYPDRHLVVVHDAGASRIPWETVRIGDGFPALRAGLSHRYEAANLSVAKWLEARQQNERLNILLIVNPTGDLAGAATEGARIEQLIGELGASVRYRKLEGEQARKGELIACFGSGEFDAIHYAGHAFFDPEQRVRSGLLCAGREVLSGEDLAGIGNLPSLMFFNACEAARVRGGDPANAAPTSHSEIVQRNIGFAEALLRGGIANFIGTYWPVGDDPAMAFAGAFYKRLLEGASLDDALRTGREAVKAAKSPDWADYVFYGNPSFLLKMRSSQV